MSPFERCCGAAWLIDGDISDEWKRTTAVEGDERGAEERAEFGGGSRSSEDQLSASQASMEALSEKRGRWFGARLARSERMAADETGVAQKDFGS